MIYLYIDRKILATFLFDKGKSAINQVTEIFTDFIKSYIESKQDEPATMDDISALINRMTWKLVPRPLPSLSRPVDREALLARARKIMEDNKDVSNLD